MATRKRKAGYRLSMKVDENVSRKLKQLQVSLRGPTIARALHEGASMIAVAARAEAPEDTGQLRRGVYVASIIKNEYQPLVRSRNGQRLNSKLRFPPYPKQAVVLSSVFYTRWIERGRTARGAMYGPGFSCPAHERQAVGKIRKRPFFQRAKRRMRKPAQIHVQRRLVQLVEGAWSR